MKKSDNILDNHLRKALTEVCETALEKIAGFKWLTHLANYRNFPNSLVVICVFETNAALDNVKLNNQDQVLIKLIRKELLSVEINISDFNKHVKFDTEENCQKENDGRWNQRLNEQTIH